MKVRFSVPELAAVPVEERAALVRRCLASDERRTYNVRAAALILVGAVVLVALLAALPLFISVPAYWLVFAVSATVYLIAAVALRIRGEIKLIRRLLGEALAARQSGAHSPECVDGPDVKGENT
jgi:hypothetical protein